MTGTTGAGLPGLRSLDHVAFTVPDLSQAVDFFTEHLGAVEVFRDGPFREVGDRLDVHPRATCRLAMLRLGSTTNLELFEYEAPDQRADPPRNSDVGGHHMAFYVDDVDAARRHLERVPGVRLMTGPNGVADDSPVAGQQWFYFTTPWGLHLEITTDGADRFYDGLPGAGMVPPAGAVPSPSRPDEDDPDM